MNTQKVQEIIIKVIITFFEAAIAYWIASGQKLDKIGLAGAVGAGVSAVYNITKHYWEN